MHLKGRKVSRSRQRKKNRRERNLDEVRVKKDQPGFCGKNRKSPAKTRGDKGEEKKGHSESLEIGGKGFAPAEITEGKDSEKGNNKEKEGW